MKSCFSFKFKIGMLALSALGMVACGSSSKTPKRRPQPPRVENTCPKGLAIYLGLDDDLQDDGMLAAGAERIKLKDQEAVSGNDVNSVYLFDMNDSSYKAVYFDTENKKIVQASDPKAVKYERALCFNGGDFTASSMSYCYVRKRLDGAWHIPSWYEVGGNYMDMPAFYDPIRDTISINSPLESGGYSHAEVQGQYGVYWDQTFASHYLRVMRKILANKGVRYNRNDFSNAFTRRKLNFDALFGDIRDRKQASPVDTARAHFRNDVLKLAKLLHSESPIEFERHFNSARANTDNYSVADLVEEYEKAADADIALGDGVLDLSSRTFSDVSNACVQLVLDKVDLDEQEYHSPVKSIDLRGNGMSKSDLEKVLRLLNQRDENGNRVVGKSVTKIFVEGNAFDNTAVNEIQHSTEFKGLVGELQSLGQIEIVFDETMPSPSVSEAEGNLEPYKAAS